MVDIRELNALIEQKSSFIDTLMMGMNQNIVGQKHLIESLLVGLLADGHVLLEGVPGLAKTMAIKTLSQLIDADFSRIQFTPDLLPADVIGTMIYSPKTEDFSIKKGPIFANFVLADEINRAPAKVQSALLEAMQERQISIGDTTHKLPSPFLVLATQNPIEQEGTYPLPEAQVDRFMLKVVISYPKKEEEKFSKTLSDGLKEFIEKDLECKHYRYRRGYKNVIDKAVELCEQGIDCPLAIETSGHAALQENYFLDDGAYLCTKIIKFI